jgi:hypothetical protein
MNCNRVKRILAAGEGEGSTPGEQGQVRLHLARCHSCVAASQQYARTRQELKALPALKPPAHLATTLRILASRDRARRLAGETVPTPWAEWAASLRFRASLMMRPLAVPVAGGLLSAILLFGLVFPNFMPLRHDGGFDVPTMLSTEPIFVGMGPFGFGEDEVVVDIIVDGQGRFVAYSLPPGQPWANDPAARKALENALLFTRFSPGTTFGLPASSKIRFTLRRSHIDVRG